MVVLIIGGNKYIWKKLLSGITIETVKSPVQQQFNN